RSSRHLAGECGRRERAARGGRWRRPRGHTTRGAWTRSRGRETRRGRCPTACPLYLIRFGVQSIPATSATFVTSRQSFYARVALEAEANSPLSRRSRLEPQPRRVVAAPRAFSIDAE